MHILQGYIHTHKLMEACPCPERFKGHKTEMITIEGCTNVQNKPTKMLGWFLVVFCFPYVPSFLLSVFIGGGTFSSLWISNHSFNSPEDQPASNSAV